MNVVIADDNIKVCEGIQDIIKDDFPEFKIQGLYYEGGSLIKHLEKNIPDILITDICMPEFNGLDACRKIRERSPLTQIILISGYQEFEYAKAAIKCGVLAYLTKPFSNDELIEAIKNAKKKVEKHLCFSVAQTDLYFSKRKELETYIKGIYSFSRKPEVISDFLLLNQTQPAKNCTVIEGSVVAKDTSLQIFDDLNFESNLLTSFRINSCNFVCFFLNFDSVNDFLNDIKKSAALYKTDAEIKNIKEYSFSEWCSALKYRQIAKNYADAVKNANTKKFIADNTELDSLSNKALQAIFNEVNRLLKNDIALSDFKNSSKSPVYIFEKYAEIFYSLDNQKNIIERTKDYIAKNYSNNLLSLTLIANHLNLSVSYLSNLFKKETGIKLSEYITSVRISEAREKFKDNRLSVNEIATLVGFNDIHYFYKKFKKETGLTPAQFRKKVK